MVAQAMPADTTVSIVTFYPGSEIYELEGHTALRITTPEADMAVSYGMFDFAEPNFVYRFVKGQTDYSIGAVPWVLMMDSYAAQGRRTVQRTLTMTSAQKKRLMQLLAENLRPENRRYRYNYVLDNCATRPLRMVERAMADTILLGHGPANLQGVDTWRGAMRRYHANYPWYQFGIDMALGSGMDRPVSRREMSFAPAALDAMLQDATIGGKPLVAETSVLYDSAPDAAIAPPTPWYAMPMAAMCALLVLVTSVTAVNLKRGTWSRWLDTLLYGSLGTAGCVVAFLVFCSSHEGTSPNWLIGPVNPALYLIAVLIWIKKAKKLVLWLQIVNFAVLAATCIAWPWLGQSGNAAFVPLALADAIRSGAYIYTGFKPLPKTTK